VTTSALTTAIALLLFVGLVAVTLFREILRQRPSSPSLGWVRAPLLLAFAAVVIARFAILARGG
jgi:hypothetical protein